MPEGRSFSFNFPTSPEWEEEMEMRRRTKQMLGAKTQEEMEALVREWRANPLDSAEKPPGES